MDSRKCKRIALISGLFFLVFFAVGNLTVKSARQNYEEAAAEMALLTEERPDLEAVFAGILTGKNRKEFRYEGIKPNQIQVGEGLLEKYGYSFEDSLQQYIVFNYGRGIGIALASTIGVSLYIVLHSMGKKKVSKEYAEFLEEKLKEEKSRNRKMESMLHKEEQEIKSLITDIAHQLKTPVASLKMSYEIENSTKLSKKEVKEFREKEYDDVKRLEYLLQAFTQITRLETGAVQICPQKESFKLTLASAVTGVYVKAMNKGIRIEVEEFENIFVSHDSKWTAEAIMNVLDNAIKYSAAGSCIRIRVLEMHTSFMIEVEDEGIGIPAQERTKIFQRFYRGASEVVRNEEGSGVGLYLTRWILEQQGGTICVKTGKTGGSNFVMTLPKE